MDGRDIGTVVFPNAELKIFVTASAEVRAQRRYDELKAKGMEADFDDILKNVQERDYLDSHREISPLRKADDAIELDNSFMTIDEQNEWLLSRYKEVMNK
jgi:cytidylate kinase